MEQEEKQQSINKENLLNKDSIIKQDYPEEPKNNLLKWIIIPIIVLIILIGGYFIYQYYFNNQNIEEPVVCTEEAKVCPDGTTVSRILPDCEFAECPEDSTADEADWKTYRNEGYGFEIDYPENFQFNEYDLSKVTGGKIHQFQFVGDGQMSDFNIHIWDLSTENSQIISDNFMGLELREENDVFINNKPSTELVYYGPSNILGGMHIYRLYIVRNGEYAYALHGGLCMDEKISECNQILSTFKFTE